MAREDRPATQLTGEEDHIVHATWSRSGKNLILTIARDAHWRDYQQVLLSPAQAEDLAAFLAARPEQTCRRTADGAPVSLSPTVP